MEETFRNISLEERFKEALRKAEDTRRYVNERNSNSEPTISECLAYDMQYVEEYVKQLKEENKKMAEEYLIENPGMAKYLYENYIFKKEIREKIEELKSKGKIINQTFPDCGEYYYHREIKVLEELLEENE